MKHSLLLMMTLLLPVSKAVFPYPYGEAEGDFMGLAVDNGYNVLDMDEKIKFFTHSYDELYINTDGILSFGAEFTENIPQEFPLETDDAVAALFWADHDLSVAGGKIWFRASNDSDVIQRAENDVQNQFRDCAQGFSPTRVYVVTWENITYQGVTKLDECLLSFDEEFCTCAYVDGFSHEYCECMAVYNDTDFCKCYTVHHCIVYCKCIMTYNDRFCECQFLEGLEKFPGECDCLRIYNGRIDICDCMDEYHNETYCECFVGYDSATCDCHVFDGNPLFLCYCIYSLEMSEDYCNCMDEDDRYPFCLCKEEGHSDEFCNCIYSFNREPGRDEICDCVNKTGELDICICNYRYGNWEICECMVTGHDFNECACYVKFKDWDFCNCYVGRDSINSNTEFFCRCIVEGHDPETCACNTYFAVFELCECITFGFKDVNYCECMIDHDSESLCACYSCTEDYELCECRESHGSGPYCECYLEFKDEDFCHCLINEVKLDFCECRYFDDYSFSFCTCMEEYNNFEFCECWVREENEEFCECYVDKADAEFCNCLIINELEFCDCMKTYGNEEFCECFLSTHLENFCSCQIQYHDEELCSCFQQNSRHGIDYCRCYLEYAHDTFCQCYVAYADIDLCNCYTQYLSIDVCMCLSNYSDPLFCQCLFLVNDFTYCECFSAIVDCTFCECYISDYEPDFCDILISKELDVDIKRLSGGSISQNLFGESTHHQMKEAHASMKGDADFQKQQNVLIDVPNAPKNKNLQQNGLKLYSSRYEKIMKHQINDRPADRQDWEERKSVRRRANPFKADDSVKKTMNGQKSTYEKTMEKTHTSVNENEDELIDMLKEMGLKNEVIENIKNGIQPDSYKKLDTKTQQVAKDETPSWKSNMKTKSQNRIETKKMGKFSEDLTIGNKGQLIQNKAGILLHNTYQAVLITDGVMSFVMFNYETITWLTGNSGGGVNGQGGIMASVGLNKRNSQFGFNHSYSMSTQLFSLVTDSNTGQSGQWMYLVSKNKRLLGPGCELLMSN